MIGPIDNNLSTTSDSSAEKFSGQVLKEARENLKISLEEVAERLHLDIEIIRALESNNYAVLPGRTYIKGYLRSYAALLGIPVKDISFSVSEPVNQAQLLPENVNYKNETKARKFMYLWVSAALLFVLLVFSELIQVVDTNQVPQKQEISKKTGPTSTVTHEDSSNVISDIETAKKPEVVITKPVTQLQTDVVVTKEDKPVRFTGLVLKYEKSSWTEVYSADGKKLVYGMINSGEKIQVKGLQPFSVILGNADGVKVEFAGKAFSTEKYTRHGMAQFVIGSSFNNKK